MNTPTPIELTADEMRRHMLLVDDLRQLQTFIDTMLEQGKIKMRKQQEKNQEFWVALGEKYEIDLKNVDWQVHGNHIVPVQVRMQPAATTNEDPYQDPAPKGVTD